ncbi:MAG: hypothetical protein M1828_004708 [Chrysothrix sp. TS-e1954]|nr:MAG: hypothetical protein M1828_004708 [Chrysothrix sp. TS-e1954]
MGGLVINSAAGNKPPWTLKAKAIHGKFDSARAKKHFGLEKVKTPEVFPIVTLLPLRSLVFIKEIHPQKLESTFREMFVALWEQNQDISKPELCAQALQRNFSEEGVRQILDAAGGADAKQKLQENTQKALDLGAFGAPWFQVTNKHGKAEPFFGSDRFHFMWEFLGLPWNNISISPSSKL